MLFAGQRYQVGDAEGGEHGMRMVRRQLQVTGHVIALAVEQEVAGEHGLVQRRIPGSIGGEPQAVAMAASPSPRPRGAPPACEP